MLTKTIKSLLFTSICAVSCTSIFIPFNRAVKAKDIIANLVNKTLTSDMMEEYARGRLTFRIDYWQDQLTQWQQRWNQQINKDFKVRALSQEAFAELSQIPYYIVAAQAYGHDLGKVQEEMLDKIYVYSDTAAQSIYQAWYNEDLTDCHDTLAWTVRHDDVCTLFINDFADKNWQDIENKDYQCFNAFHTIEHELTHVEQKFDAYMLTQAVAGNAVANKILNAIDPGVADRYLAMGMVYELLLTFERIENNEIDAPNLGKYADYDACSRVQCERDADTIGLQFAECPMMAYDEYQEYLESEKPITVSKKNCYDEKGYITEKNKIRLLKERLVMEGHLKPA